MRHLLPLLALAATLLVSAAPARAGGGTWIFNPSYYSHDPVQNVRIGHRVSTGPYYTQPQGEYVRAGYRYMNSNIVVGGRSLDHLHVWESWVQSGEQF